jgi:chitinase
MRAAFGSRFGLSCVLAPDYWYLQGFDPKSMERYVDWMGFMAYDLRALHLPPPPGSLIQSG